MTCLLCGSPSSRASSCLGVPATISQGYREVKMELAGLKDGWMSVTALPLAPQSPPLLRSLAGSCMIGGTQSGGYVSTRNHQADAHDRMRASTHTGIHFSVHCTGTRLCIVCRAGCSFKGLYFPFTLCMCYMCIWMCTGGGHCPPYSLELGPVTQPWS